MSQELNVDLLSWWNEQSFAGKELFRLEEDGSLVLSANNNIKERTIATITPENGDVVIKTLQEKFDAVTSRVKELEIEWIAAEDKLKLADKVAAVKEYVHNTNALGDFEKPVSLVRDWEHTLYQLTEANHAAKLKLAELAESLAESEQWKEATQAFKDIADLWKQAGYLDKFRNDKLWNRIEAARKAFNDRKKTQHEEDEKDLLINLDLKIDLVEQAEAIAASEDWKKTTEAFHRLTDEWKTIGRAHNKKNEELWNRFMAAKSAFFDKKRDHFAQVQAEQEQNYISKAALLEKAEALKESTDWGNTAKAFSALMEEWKKTGRVPQEKGDDLWHAFTAAQEHFFSAKRQHTDAISQEQNANYELKKELLDRALRLKNSTRWGETSAEYTELLEEWKKIGPVPRIHSEKMWEDFLAARKHFFARKDENREQRKQYAVDQQAARIADAKAMIGKHREELKEEQEKIVDFKTAIENITPGKKAEELRSHLEKLITESTRQIARLQEKLALAESADKEVEQAEESTVEQGESGGQPNEL